MLFVADDQRRRVTTAELTPEDKDAISHRGKALREIAPLVADVLVGSAARRRPRRAACARRDSNSHWART